MIELRVLTPDDGARVIRLAVTEGNESAIALYRRCGFADTGELGDLMPDGIRREHIMAKALTTRDLRPSSAVDHEG